jgi:ABC-2 type transport system permease protein
MTGHGPVLLPGFLLSGFIYSISSMPRVIQAIALFVPARYFITVRKLRQKVA